MSERDDVIKALDMISNSMKISSNEAAAESQRLAGRGDPYGAASYASKAHIFSSIGCAVGEAAYYLVKSAPPTTE